MDIKNKHLETSNNNLFSTRDLYLAAYIYTQDIELAKTEKRGKDYYFFFYPFVDAKHLSKKYWSRKTVELSPQLYADSIKALKQKIFNNNSLNEGSDGK